MKRKLIQQRDSLTVTLPKKWTDKFKLKGGEEIDIEEKDFNLLIKSPGIKEKRETTFKITKDTKESLYKSILNHTYRKGYDRIKIKYFSPTVLPKIEDFVSRFYLGFAVVEKEDDYCILENIAEPTEEKYDVLIRRCFLLTKEMASMIYDACEKGKFEETERLIKYSNDIEKFSFFCRRVVSKGFFTKGESNLYWELFIGLMRIERSYLSLGIYLSKKKKFTVNKKIQDMFKKSIYFYNLFYEAYHQKDINKIEEMADLKDGLLYEPTYKIIEKATGPEAVIAYHIRETSRLSYTAASPVFAMML